MTNGILVFLSVAVLHRFYCISWLVCDLWLWHFLVIFTRYFWLCTCCFHLHSGEEQTVHKMGSTKCVHLCKSMKTGFLVKWSKIVSMIRKYHNNKPQTTLWHREEEPLNHHGTPGRQIQQSLPHQDDCNTRTDTKQRATKHRTITDSHNGRFSPKPKSSGAQEVNWHAD